MAASSLSSRRVLVLLLVSALVLMTVDSRGSGPIGAVRGAAISGTAPFRSAIGWLVSPLGAVYNGAVHYDDVVDENAELRAEVARLKGQLADAPAAAAELELLKKAIELPVDAETPTLVAKVVEDRNTGVERILEIDRGSEDGLVVGMAVVTAEGLVGRISEVLSGHRSVVRPLTDGRMSVGVTTRRTGAFGTTAGVGTGEPLEVDILIADRGEVREGDIFQTTGFVSSKYPPNVRVGRLRVDVDTGQYFMEPTVDFDNLVYVSIILVIYD